MSFRRLLNIFIDKETIGHPDCPLMERWTFFDLTGTKLAARFPLFDVKAMVHFFPADVDDKDPHDHPRSFVTFVLKGSYIDTRWEKLPERPKDESPRFGDPTSEIVSAPAVRFRPAEHMHIVETSPGEGCWTVVVMGPAKRPWGFLRLNSQRWLGFQGYIEKYGGTPRCDADDGDRSHEIHTSSNGDGSE